MSFACSSSVSPGELVAGTVVVFVMVFGRCGCKICENCELIRAALVVSVVARTALVGLIAIRPVFQAE